MLEKIKNQENVILIFFVVTLAFMFGCVVVEKNVVDVIYFGVLVYYFVRFLKIRNNGK